MFKYPLSTESKVLCYALNNPEVDVSRSVSYTTIECGSSQKCLLYMSFRILCLVIIAIDYGQLRGFEV